ncbi:hypothetical protein GCM10011611_39970 [Aliidongia dinghuensis]|uniref:VWFA domain-containing protein n=1 Tax=Aliidongia dinghuensis TaxID=1867774 RepID=A0A8J2YXT1_9PROT|nr:DUF1194 domain-containing protein [Aliidongia dinghuensis]GGF29899.1 hypothetical protein GCM10011611_39970 [Aliidongia dinghuensis]
MKHWLTAILLLAAASLPIATGARAAEPVDTALVIAVDVSLSVNDERYELQRDGTAAAIASPDFTKAVSAGPNGAVAVTVMEFSDPDRQIVVMPWTRIASAADAQAFAQKLHQVHRSSSGLTGIANALLAAEDLLVDSPWPATRRVVDVSGDGMSNIGPPIEEVRDKLVTDGITINGLPILTEEPWLETYYTLYVIGGPGAFVIVAQDLDSFADAMRRKLVAEVTVSGLSPLPRSPLLEMQRAGPHWPARPWLSRG